MRVFGHPLHPMLVHFPVAFWTLATVCDGCALAGFVSGRPYAVGLLALGLVVAIPAMVSGFFDLAGLKGDAVPDGGRHMLLMSSAWAFYLFALITRLDENVLAPDSQLLPRLLGLVGFCLIAVGGWFGGRLVYHHGAGVKRDG